MITQRSERPLGKGPLEQLLDRFSRARYLLIAAGFVAVWAIELGYLWAMTGDRRPGGSVTFDGVPIVSLYDLAAARERAR